MDTTKTASTKEKKNKPTFRESYNRLTLITLIGGLIVLFSDIAPGVKPLVPSALGYTLFVWLFITGLPLLWSQKKVWFPQLLTLLKSVKHGSQVVHSALPAMPSIQEMKTTLKPSIPEQPLISSNELPAPFHLLPANPKAAIIAVLTKEVASKKIEDALQLSGISFEGTIDILEIQSGPSIIGINFRLPDKVQASTLIKKKEDIANHMGYSKTLSIEASVNHRSAVCFVVPKKEEERSFVYMRDVIPEFLQTARSGGIPIILGRDMQGKALIADLTKFPHLLLAGTTGSGKSVQINTMIESIVMYHSPDQVRLILIDPKRVELGVYNGYPHLLIPVVTEPQRAALVLKQMCMEMEKRYDLFAKQGVRNLVQYNKKVADPLPYIVITIDEYADLMLVASGDVEDSVQRLGQLARAAGIHLIIGTQRPSVDVITGTIKANLPTRMAFSMKSGHDYRTVMDKNGPTLLGNGDGVFVLNAGTEYRFQSAAISVDDDESTALIENVKQYWLQQYRKDPIQRTSLTSPTNHDPYHEDPDEPGQTTMRIDPPSSTSNKVSTTPVQVSVTPQIIDEPIVMPSVQPVHKVEWAEDQEKFVYPENTYQVALSILEKQDGINVDLLKINMGISFDQATQYMGMMHNAGLLGEFIDGKREYLRSTGSKLSEDELLEQVKLHIFETGKVSSEALAKQFTIQKSKMISVLKSLAEEGVLHRPETNGSSYTIAWDEQDIQSYLDNNRSFSDLPY